MNLTFREASGAVGVEVAFAQLMHQALGEDAPRRIAGAEKQNVEGLPGHLAAHPQQLVEQHAASSPAAGLRASIMAEAT
jgi:hypothetical protein